MIIENLSYGKNNNKINVDGYYYDGNSTLTLLTDGISSKSFNGIIPKVTKEVILYNKYTGSFNIKVGQEIGILEYDEVYRYYTILKIYTDENLKYFGKLNPQDGAMEDQDYFPEFTSNVFIDYLRSDGEILTYVIQTTLTEGFPDNLVQVSYEDWSSKSIGTSGWAITSQGNSIFNNVAVRGSIDAVDGNFSGALTVNNGEMKIGAGVSVSTQYTITQYSSLNNIVTLTLDTVHPFQVGEKIIVSSLPSIDLSYINLNGTYTVSAIDTYTVSYDFEQTIYPVYDNAETIIRDADIPDTIVTRGSVGSSSLSDGIHINDYNYWHSTGDILIGDPDSSFSWNSTTNQLVINGANVTIGSAVNIEAGVTTSSLTVGTPPNALVISNNSDGVGNPGIYLNSDNYWYSSGNFLVGDTTLLGEGMIGNPAAYIRVLPGDRTVEISGLINAYSGRIGASPYGDSNVGWAINEATLSSANGNVGLYSPTYTTGTAGVTGTSGASTVTVLKSGLTDPLILPLVGMSITGTGIAPGAYISSLVDNPTNYVLTLSSANAATVSGTATYSEYAIYAGNFTRELSPFKVDYSGNLSATSGVIGGWKIGATSLTAGALTTAVGMNTTGYPFYAGDVTPANAEFRVTSAGALTATSATITGSIYATGGYIGGSTSGWTVTTNKFYNGKLTLNAPVSTATTGTGTLSENASVYRVILTSPTITPTIGMTITGTGIKPGTQINIVTGTGPYTIDLTEMKSGTVSGTATISEIGIWAGASTGSPTFAPFRVDYSGNLYADSATIAGTINATGGTFTNKVIIGGAITGSLQVGTGTNKINIFGNLTDGGTYINTGTTTASAGSGFYLDATGRVRIAGPTDSLTFDASGALTITGTINANAGGTIGGFTMGATSLYGGTTPNIVGLIPGSTTAAIFAGATSNTGTGAVFKVTNAGVLTATGATINGTINASAGNFTNTVYVGNNATAGNNIHLIGTATNTTTAIAMGTSGVSDYNTSTTKFWADASGRFSLGQNLTWSGTALTILGTIKATDGLIGSSSGGTGGWVIAANLLSNGSVGLFAPTSTTGTGTVAGTSGTSTVTITSPTITPAANMSIIGTNIATGAYITAVGGTGPYTLTLSAANTGTVSGTGTISNYAIYAGNASKQLAPFKIDYAGNLTATNANISGIINATSGAIGSAANKWYIGDATYASQGLIQSYALNLVTPGNTVYTSPAITLVTPSSPYPGYVTYTATGHLLNVGDHVTISGITSLNSAYNGVYNIYSKTANTFTVRVNYLTETPSSYVGAKAVRNDYVSGVKINSSGYVEALGTNGSILDISSSVNLYKDYFASGLSLNYNSQEGLEYHEPAGILLGDPAGVGYSSLQVIGAASTKITGAISGTSGSTAVTISNPKDTPSVGMLISGTGIATGAVVTNVSGGFGFVTGVTPSSPTVGSATYTATGHSFVVGDVVTISGSSVAGYNGTFTITAVTPKVSFRVANATTTTGSTWTIDATYGNATTVKDFAVTAVTASSPSVGFATYTATGHNFVIGDSVDITGASVAGYNGTFTITAVATNTFTVANTTTGAATWSFGDAYNNGKFYLTVSAANTSAVSGTGTLLVDYKRGYAYFDGDGSVGFGGDLRDFYSNNSESYSAFGNSITAKFWGNQSIHPYDGFWSVSFKKEPNNSITGVGAGFTDALRLDSSGMYTNGTILRLSGVYNRTSTSAGNMLIATNPLAEVYRSTASSQRWKNSIDYLAGELEASKLLDLPVRQFKFNNDYLNKEDKRFDTLVPGFVAEEVAEHYPIAAEMGEGGEVDDWNIRMLIPPMLKLIQDQDAKIKDLENRLAALES